jgi:EAL domain-containing protein (putative c-di-GMP-specific phosphodiesterase class I)
MKKYVIVAESGSDITPVVAERYGIRIASMHVSFGGTSLDDGKFPPSDVFRHYEKTGELPRTSGCTPQDFIPLFERNGLIHVVDSYVWSETAAQIARWRDKLGYTLPVSVNLSRTDVFDPMLERNLMELIRNNGLTPNELKLEVTESAYTDDAEQLITVIEHLRQMGFQVEMDDFGSGYSSLNMLSSLPVDVLKMDMKFIQNIEANDKDFRLVELILDIAKYLNVPVVAEGVETLNQLELLRHAGCDLVQGYYFSRPLPPEEFEELIIKEQQLIRKEEEKQ